MNLQDFCSKDSTRLSINAPWSVGEYTYATDGHILIRVPRLPDVPGNPAAPGTEKLFAETVAAGEWLDVSDLPDIEYDSCKECNGTGKQGAICDKCDGEDHRSYPTCEDGSVECEDCDGTGLGKADGEIICEDCSGSGKQKKKQPVKIGKEHVDARLLRLIKDLPGIKVANSEKTLGPLIFRFDDGDGLVMPMRPPSDRQVGRK